MLTACIQMILVRIIDIRIRAVNRICHHIQRLRQKNIIVVTQHNKLSGRLLNPVIRILGNSLILLYRNIADPLILPAVLLTNRPDRILIPIAGIDQTQLPVAVYLILNTLYQLPQKRNLRVIHRNDNTEPDILCDLFQLHLAHRPRLRPEQQIIHRTHSMMSGNIYDLAWYLNKRNLSFYFFNGFYYITGSHRIPLFPVASVLILLCCQFLNIPFMF